MEKKPQNKERVEAAGAANGRHGVQGLWRFGLSRLRSSPLAWLGGMLPSVCQLRGDGCTGWARRGLICDTCLHRYGYARYDSVLRCIQCAQVLHVVERPKGAARPDMQGGGVDNGLVGGEVAGAESKVGAGAAEQVVNGATGSTVVTRWRCGHCLRLRPALHSCHAAVSYSGPWRQLMGRFKSNQQAGGVGGEPALAELAAQLMLASTAIGSVVAQADVLLPVPSHRARVAARGFAPASSIAYALRRQARCHAPVVHGLRLHKEVQDQRRLNRSERFANMQGAFDMTAAARQCTGGHVVLVDDVITTGATLFAAAQALQVLKPTSVKAVVWARTPLA